MAWWHSYLNWSGSLKCRMSLHGQQFLPNSYWSTDKFLIFYREFFLLNPLPMEGLICGAIMCRRAVIRSAPSGGVNVRRLKCALRVGRRGECGRRKIRQKDDTTIMPPRSKKILQSGTDGRQDFVWPIDILGFFLPTRQASGTRK